MIKKIQSPLLMQEVLSKENPIKRGFVPTMGSLHEGHLSLIKKSLEENNSTIVSIFVNPKQFNNQDDFTNYPKNLEKDIEILKDLDIDYLFVPQIEDIYPVYHQTFVEVEKLQQYLCGKHRPGHFRGVSTICHILFNIIKPTTVYFGQKDYQQALIIKSMIQDLFLPIHFRMMPIIREKSGLAMSSRNLRLSAESRKKASEVYHTMKAFSEKIENLFQNHAWQELNLYKEEINQFKLKVKNEMEIEYFELVCADTLRDFYSLKDYQKTQRTQILLAVAFIMEDIRLIDNILIEKNL